MSDRPAAVPAPTALATLELVQSREAIAARQLQADVPRDLETICARCLEKAPRPALRHRWGLAEAGRFLRGEPIQARPAGPLERATRWVRRNPRVAALEATLAVLLVLGTVISTGFALAASRRASEAQAALQEANRQRQRADERFRRCSDAGIDVHLKLLSPKYRDQASLGPLRQTLTDQTFRSIAAFIDEDSTDPQVRFETGCACIYLGVLHGILGHPEQATESFQRAVRVLTALVADFPANAVYRQAGPGLQSAGTKLAGARGRPGGAPGGSACAGALPRGRAPRSHRLSRFELSGLGPDHLRGEGPPQPHRGGSLRRGGGGVGTEQQQLLEHPGGGSPCRGRPQGRHRGAGASAGAGRPGREVYSWFYLAMAYTQSGKQAEAHRWYEKRTPGEWRTAPRTMTSAAWTGKQRACSVQSAPIPATTDCRIVCSSPFGIETPYGRERPFYIDQERRRAGQAANS